MLVMMKFFHLYQVRAVTTNEDDRLEANLEHSQRTARVEISKTASGNSAINSAITGSTAPTVCMPLFNDALSMAPLKGEEIFVAHLYHRAQLLNPEFQGRILELVQGHAVPENDMQEAENRMEPMADVSLEHYLPEVGQAVVVNIGSGFDNTCNVGTAANTPFVQAGAGISLSTAHLTFRNVSGGTPINHSHLKNESDRHQQSNSLCGSCSHDLRCIFSGGSRDRVEVCAGTVKTQTRMREKLAEYAMEGMAWPLTACILDPVRASVVCTGPAQILEVANWFINAGNASLANSGDSDMQARGWDLEGKLLVCRIKNKFSLDKFQLVRL